jgi:hypothetical protein
MFISLIAITPINMKYTETNYGLTKRKDLKIIPIVIILTTFLITINLLCNNIYAQSTCLPRNVQHWDKIIFKITNPDLAKKAKFDPNTELDIKVIDDPNKVADIKQKVLDFLHVANASKNDINITNVDYAIICVGQG